MVLCSRRKLAVMAGVLVCSSVAALGAVRYTTGEYVFKGPVAAGARRCLVQLGATAISGGSSNGTYLGANVPSTFSGNLVDLQKNGTSQFKVTGSGAVTTTGAITAPTLHSTTATLNGDGAVGAPAYSFSKDTNTGIYRIGNDQVGISTNGALMLKVDTGGVTSSGAITAPTLHSTTATLNGDGAVGAPAYSFSKDTNTGIYRIGDDQVGIGTNGTLMLKVDTGGVTSSGWVAAGGDKVVLQATGITMDPTASLKLPSNPPAAANSAGSTGQIAWDENSIYICTTGGAEGEAVWKKVAIATWP